MLHIFMLLLAASPFTDAVRRRIDPDLPKPIASLECPEPASGEAECRGTLVDGRVVILKVTARGETDADIRADVMHPPDDVIRAVARGALPSEVRSFACDDLEAYSGKPFACDGKLVDGSSIKVWAQLEGRTSFGVDRVSFDAAQRTPFLDRTRAFLGRFHDSPVTAIDCTPPAPQEPDRVSCVATFRDGGQRSFFAEREDDGSLVAKRSALDRALIAAWVASLVAGPILLIIGIAMFLRAREASIVARRPLAAEQSVRFDAPAPYVMHISAPMFTFSYWGLQFRMFGIRDRAEVASIPLFFRVRTSGIRYATSALRRFFVPAAGKYVLRVEGLDPHRDVSSVTILFTRPWPLRDYLGIVAAIAGGFLSWMALMGFLVFGNAF